MPFAIPDPGMIGLDARIHGLDELVDGAIIKNFGIQIVKIPSLTAVLVEYTRGISMWKAILLPIPGPAGYVANCGAAKKNYTLLLGSAAEPYEFNAHAVIPGGIPSDAKNDGCSKRDGCRQISYGLDKQQHFNIKTCYLKGQSIVPWEVREIGQRLEEGKGTAEAEAEGWKGTKHIPYLFDRSF